MTALPEQDRIREAIFEACCRRRTREKKRGYLGMSSIGHNCERKIWYDFRGFPAIPIEGRAIRIFDAGHDTETRVICDLIDAGFHIEGRQLEFSDFNGHFRGHCDGIINGITSRPHILEIKSANKAKFDSFKRFGVQKTYPVYYCQVQLYMGYSGLDRALFVIDCKDNSDIYTERINYIPYDFEQLRERARRIIYAETEPLQAFKPQSMECQWCDFRVTCWTPEEVIIMDGDRTCGTCYYFGFVGLTKVCRHPEHPYSIQQWGIGCSDWSYLAAKEFPARPLNRPERLTNDEIKARHDAYSSR